MKLKHLSLAAVLAASVLLVGCGSMQIPPKLQVKDVSSGRTYTTYEPWGQVEKGIGYEFTDIDTGNRITLTNYELKTLEGEKSVPKESPEATAFQQAKTAGG